MNARIYCLLLRLYPAELRYDFGAEMTQVFLDDIDDSGAARVWWRALKELFRIALPAALSRRLVLVPLLMYVLETVYTGSIIVLFHGDARSTLPKSGWEIISVALSSLVPAIVAFVALRVGDRSVPEPLSLR